MPHTYPPDSGKDAPCPHAYSITDITAAPSATESAVAKHPPADYVAKPSRWNTPEFYLYYVVFVVFVPYMVYVPMRLSRGM